MNTRALDSRRQRILKVLNSCQILKYRFFSGCRKNILAQRFLVMHRYVQLTGISAIMMMVHLFQHLQGTQYREVLSAPQKFIG